MQDQSTRLPLGVNRLVVAFCGDYDRRQDAIRKGSAPPETLAWFSHLNNAINVALADVCEASICTQMRKDIGDGRGARRTPIYFLSEGAYKKRKRAAKYRIAKQLKLV